MGDYVAFEAPAWLPIVAALILFASGGALGALAAIAVQLLRGCGAAHEERDTIPAAPPSTELPADRDTSPDFPWHTHVQP